MQAINSNEEAQRKAAKGYTLLTRRKRKESIQVLVDSGYEMNMIVVDLPQVMNMN